MNKRYYYILAIGWAAFFIIAAATHRPPPVDPNALIAQGYGGPISLRLELDKTGAISFARVLEHQETPSYVARLDTFISSFHGLPRNSPLVLGKDIDAISGATVTSAAITDTIRSERDRRIGRAPRPSIRPIDPLKIITPLLLTALAAMALARRSFALRWTALIAGLIYFGIMTRTMLSIVQVSRLGAWHMPGFGSDTLGWMVLGISLSSALIVGRIFCGSLCPFASIQEWLYRFTLHRHADTELVDPHIDSRARSIKYAVLFIIPALCFMAGSMAPAHIEPYITLFTGHGSKLAWLFLALILVLAVFNFRFWCKYICPAGALTGLVSLFSLWKIRASRQCTACGDCSRICPTAAISTDSKGIPQVDSTECIACAKCLRACAVNALKLRIRADTANDHDQKT